MLSSKLRRRLHLLCVLAGALAGACLPFLVQELSGSRFTDIDARPGYSSLAILANALYGALAGWAIGAFIRHLLGDR